MISFWIFILLHWSTSVQFCSVAQSCSTVRNPMKCSMPGLPVYHQLPESTETHVHWGGDAIQPSHPLLSPSPPVLNLSQHQGLFKWVSLLHQVAKVLEFQLQYQSVRWTPRTYLLEDGLVGSPWSTRDSQESSLTPQFKSIDSSVLSFLFFFYSFFYYYFFIVVDFVIHWNETAMGLHVFPIPIPLPTSPSTRSL